MRLFCATITVLSTVGLLASCGRLNPVAVNSQGLGSSNEAVDSPMHTITSALSTASQGLDDAENASVLGASSVSAAAATTCPSSRSTCTGSARTVGFNNCFYGNGTMFGVVSLNYGGTNPAQSCLDSTTSVPGIGTTLTRTTSDLVFTASDGTKTRLTSDSLKNYNAVDVLGGETITYTGTAQYSVFITGFTRIRMTAGNLPIFHHSVRSVVGQPLLAQGSRATNDRIVTSGAIDVDHNIARYTSRINFGGLVWTAGCCYPSSGNLSASFTGATSGIVSVSFNASPCGSVQITTTAGGASSTSNLVLQSCN